MTNINIFDLNYGHKWDSIWNTDHQNLRQRNHITQERSIILVKRELYEMNYDLRIHVEFIQQITDTIII